MATDDLASQSTPADTETTGSGERSGVSLEARLGMCVVVVLLCAFGFLVYRKFDARQQQLLNMTAANLTSSDTDASAQNENVQNANALSSTVLHETVPVESGAVPESLQTSFRTRDADPFGDREVPSAAMQSGNSLFRPTASVQQPREDSPLPVQPSAVFDFDEPVVQPSETTAASSGSQNADPFAVAASDELPQGSLFADFPSAAPAPEPTMVVADDWAQLSEPDAAESNTQSQTDSQDVPFAFVDANADRIAAADAGEQPADEFDAGAFDFSAATITSSAPVTSGTPVANGEPVTAAGSAFDADADTNAFDGFSDELAAVEDPALLQPVDESDFDDFVPAQAPVPQPPTKSTAIAMLELPSFDDAYGETSDGSTHAPTEKTPSLLLDGFGTNERPAPAAAANDGDAAEFDSFASPGGQAPSTFASPASSARAAQSSAFNVQEFNYDHGVRQAAHTTEPCDICEVLPNDNYWSISMRAYGSARYFSALALYNQHRISDPKKMRPGMKVLIPEPDILETRYPELFRDYQTKEQLPSGFFIQDNGTPAYRIGERETLSEIAEKHLGRSSRWTQIWRLNKGTLADPNKLKTGSVIILPDDATNVQMRP